MVNNLGRFAFGYSTWTWSTGNTEFDLAYLYIMYTGIKYLDALLTLFISSSDASTLIKITLYEQSDRLDR